MVFCDLLLFFKDSTKINKKRKRQKPPSKTTRGGYLTGFESSGGRISGFIIWGVKYSTLDSLGGYVDFFPD